MHSEFYYPDSLTGAQLDFFLEAGWYRMHEGLFTTHFIAMDEELYRVFWLRYNLQMFRESKSIRKIIAANKKFSYAIKPLQVTEEMEYLYKRYQSGIDFEGAHSVHSWLYNQTTPPGIFNSWVVEVRDGSRLIAAGVFDNGDKSIAGILNFYDPEYKKHSPGKNLIVLKLQHAIASGKLWYYPGYIVHNYPKFDYKTFAGEAYCEIFVPGANKWYSYDRTLIDFLGKRIFKKRDDSSTG